MINEKILTEFLTLLFPEVNGFIELRFKKPKDKEMKQLWFKRVDVLISALQDEWDDIKECEMYYGTCLRTEQKGGKSAVKQINALWCDIDFKDVPCETVDKKILDFGHKPTIMVNSGHGYHLYWLLKEPYILSDENREQDINKIEGIMKGVSQKLGGDNTYDISRLLRIPETYNNKDKNSIKVEIREFNKISHDIKHFENLYIDTIQTNISAIEIPEKSVNVDITKLKMYRWLRLLIEDGWTQDSKYKSRSECDIAVMEGLIHTKIDDDTIYGIFRNPKYKIAEKSIEKGKNIDKYIRTTLAKAHQFYEQKQTEWAKKVEKFANFDAVIESYHKWLHIEDDDYLKVLHATLISHKFDDKPIWMLLIAPPSGTKTVVLQPLNILKDIYKIYPISELTCKTFVSGDKHYKGLLSEIDKNNGVLLFKDFTTILQLDATSRSEILQQLREIWDGHYLKRYGTGKVVEWSGKITFIAGATEYYEAFREIDQTLGERYLLYKPFIEKRDKMIQKALYQMGKEKQMKEGLQQSILTFHQQLDIPADLSITFPDEFIIKISNLADLVTRARSSVKRDFRKEVEYVPTPEAPTRLAQQLVCLAKALSIVNKNPEITEEEYRIISKVGLMTIATDRLRVIQMLKNKAENDFSTTQEISLLLKTPKITTLRLMENLYAFGIAERSEFENGVEYRWTLTPEARIMIEGAGI